MRVGAVGEGFLVPFFDLFADEAALPVAKDNDASLLNVEYSERNCTCSFLLMSVIFNDNRAIVVSESRELNYSLRHQTPILDK